MKRESRGAEATADTGGLRPGHLLALGTVAVTAAAVIMAQDRGAVGMVAAAVVAASTGLVAAALHRTLVPLTGAEPADQPDMLAGRTRAALEREKMLVLRSIKEIEFDHAMRKISVTDYQEVLTRLRARAAGLMRQLDGAAGYRALIERDLARTLGDPAPAAPAAAPPGTPLPHACAACGVVNDADARFCKACGHALGGRS